MHKLSYVEMDPRNDQSETQSVSTKNKFFRFRPALTAGVNNQRLSFCTLDDHGLE